MEPSRHQEPSEPTRAYELAEALVVKASQLLGEVAPEIEPHPEEHPTHLALVVANSEPERTRLDVDVHQDNLWAARAACKGLADELFVRGQNQDRAKAVCMTCPVRVECLEEALVNRIEWGVWGGLTERERRTLMRRKPNMSPAEVRKLVQPSSVVHGGT